VTRLWLHGQPIEVETDGDGQPVRFTWRAKKHNLETIQQRWEVDTDWWSEEGRVYRQYFAAITSGGLFCVLYCDRMDQSWHLEKIYD
jgi:hypothetical protein